MMPTERQQQAETVIREALTDLAHLTPDQIAAKLWAEGMLWCNPRRRTTSCPIHHWLETRLAAHGLEVLRLTVAPTYVMGAGVSLTRRPGIVHQNFFHRIADHPPTVQAFIQWYDRGHYKHHETPPPKP